MLNQTHSLGSNCHSSELKIAITNLEEKAMLIQDNIDNLEIAAFLKRDDIAKQEKAYSRLLYLAMVKLETEEKIFHLERKMVNKVLEIAELKKAVTREYKQEIKRRQTYNTSKLS